MGLNYRKCSVQFPLNKKALLNLIKPDGILEEEQVLKISSANGLPDGGYFSLWVDNVNYTNPIQYYSSGYEHTALLIRYALLPYRSVSVVARNAQMFKIRFTDGDAGINHPILRVKENALTLNSSLAGAISIVTEQDGHTDQCLYKVLKSVPESSWNITSFDPRNQTVCIEITNNGVTSHFTTTFQVKY